MSINKISHWSDRLKVLLDIINGLKKIHENQKVHHDFHTGNILLYTKNTFSSISNNFIPYTYISDMGLCGEICNIDKNNIYGVMPYVAPEVLKGGTYTQAADIYSFGMIMYYIVTGIQPFASRAHDYHLANDIFKGIRPEINEQEIPKYYIDLMRKCWDSNPENRPKSAEILELISLVARP